MLANRGTEFGEAPWMREAASALIVGEGLGVLVAVAAADCSIGWRAPGAHPNKPRRRSFAPTPSAHSWPLLSVTSPAPRHRVVEVLAGLAFSMTLDGEIARLVPRYSGF